MTKQSRQVWALFVAAVLGAGAAHAARADGPAAPALVPSASTSAPVPGLEGFAPLKDDRLGRVRGRGLASPNKPNLQVAVILWDERGSARPGSSQGSGAGNQITIQGAGAP